MKSEPFYVLEITKQCNLNCKYCYNVWKANPNYPKQELTAQEWQRLIDKLIDEVKPRFLTISGGEPLLRSDIFKILDHIKSHKLRINLLTNGTLLTKEIIHKCLDCGVVLFEIPLLSASALIHDNLTNYQGSWEKVIQSIAEIKSQKGKVAVVIVITKQNISDIRDTIEVAIALGVDSIMVNRFNVGGQGIKHKEDLLPSIEELKKSLNIVDELANEYEIPVSSAVSITPCLIDFKKYRNISFAYCQIGRKYPYYAIDPAGNVRPCNHSALIIGNFLNSSMKEILQNDLLLDYEKARPQECKGCSKLYECQGGCKAAAEVCYGDYRKMEPFVARNFQGILEE